MAQYGPVPERRENLIGHPRVAESEREPISHAPAAEVKWYHPGADWHPIARQLYLSAKKSGQAVYYQQSDIALLYSVCEDLSDFKKAGRRSAQMASAIYSALTGLLLSEGDRRRVRIELDTTQPEDTARKAADDFYAQLGISQ
jgi:hypothetical protein